MKKNFTLTKIALAVFLAFFILSHCHTLRAQAITENFDDNTQLAANGWSLQNLSVPVGISNWDQGQPLSMGGPFDAYNGAGNSFIAAGYRNTGNTGTISNWLMTPNRTFRNGDVITFYTRKVTPDTYADRLEVRFSDNGASTNAGNGTNGLVVGDFTTLLLSINPTLSLGIYPTTWTQYTITISGLPAPTSGRVAFRYFVTGGGYAGTASDYIGVDAFQYTPYVCPTLSISPGSLSFGAAGVSYSASFTQTGALGAPSFSITAGAPPPGTTLSSSGNLSGTPTATGTFNFTTTVADNSGCSASQSLSLTVVCGANPTTINLPVLCSNDAAASLIATGSPAGGTFSGTGVSGNDFDPAAGTQTITYDYTDAYGCAFNSSGTLTVNTAPSVSISSLDPICIGTSLTLLGSSPAGGAYSGTDVSGTSFTPSTTGTFTITYSYTDANNCSNTSAGSIVVNDLPTVTAASLPDVCLNEANVTLSFGSPAGGVYSGTNVSGGLFTPSSAGTTTIMYEYTDANGCSNSTTSDIMVNTLPVVTASALADVCQNAANVTLTGGSPAGGVYSGTNVSSGLFTPSVSGANTITYTFTDANGCSNSANTTITVNTCTNITENSSIAGLKCFPNPTTGRFIVEFDQQNEADVLVLITNAQGRTVLKEEQSSFQGNYSQAFDLNTFSKGIYTMEVHSENKTAYYKIVLQ